jgi:hypothetical protein
MHLFLQRDPFEELPKEASGGFYAFMEAKPKTIVRLQLIISIK